MTATSSPAVPEINEVDLSDLKASLALGWQDFRRAPFLGMVFSAVYVLGGWLIFWAMTTKGQVWWTLPGQRGLSHPWPLHRLRILRDFAPAGGW